MPINPPPSKKTHSSEGNSTAADNAANGASQIPSSREGHATATNGGSKTPSSREGHATATNGGSKTPSSREGNSTAANNAANGGTKKPLLTERQTIVLLGILTCYIRNGEPVGSKKVVEETNLTVSPATVRSEMAELQTLGYVTGTHSSAGRIPTQQGYRWFVDYVSSTLQTSRSQIPGDDEGIVQQLLSNATDLDDLLHRASQALTQLTNLAGLVVSPRMDYARLKHIELVALSRSTVLMVLIVDTGQVTQRIIELPRPVQSHDVARAGYTLVSVAKGLMVKDAPDAIMGVLNVAPAQMEPLITEISHAMRQIATSQQTLHFGGAAALLDSPQGLEHGELQSIRNVVSTIEEQVVVLTMLSDALKEADPIVKIGNELPIVTAEPFSVVATKYATGGSAKATGHIGVMGPSRMDYQQSLLAVQAVSELLAQAIQTMTGE